jgi:hypothetical protein
LDGQIQYNLGGAFAGAANVSIEGGELRLSAIPTPTPPAANGVKIFGRSVAGRNIPAFVGPSGLDSSLQPFLARNKIAYAQPNGNSTTVSVLGVAITAAGTATAANVATTNLHQSLRRIDYLVTTAAATAVAGFRGAATQFFMGNAPGRGGFMFVCRFGPATGVATGTHRLFCGMRSSTAAPTDVDPSTLTNIVGVGYDAADTQLQIFCNDGSGVATKIPLGTSFPKPSSDRAKVYELALFCPPNGTSIRYEVTDLDTSAVEAGELTTNIPTSTTLLNHYAYMSVGGTSSVIGMALMSLYIETDM